MAKSPPIPAPHHRQTVKHRNTKGRFRSPPASRTSRQDAAIAPTIDQTGRGDYSSYGSGSEQMNSDDAGRGTDPDNDGTTAGPADSGTDGYQ
jgi:hypothetical protein